ncbi:MFS transporter, AAHS family, 4-hydroxybenzoate transporter [Lampropedia hyalina DSM 16112]|jgi:AAHS family 4-hydroxybenzoate transporter-like MFS transporter|uniref:MFS transporter, AAHS family, 4-hydroxybenzoate transporter n=1 Tax=Lampropedia hyalina DSM 16112 TaxID=1122156 RepID=A0A1M4TT31_9BURK|nr:MFS transporter [Lampropedia hyalina]SHE47566.1 MFS transporter, AAHS family, 4-hydroxybenzoate transporter [Lampropedia hyalina DSM 16112]
MQNDQAIDIQHFIDKSRFSGFQWTIFILSFLIILIDGFDTAAIGYIAPSLLSEWDIARPQLAPVLSAALAGLAIGGIFIGPIADRFGRKYLLCLTVFLFGIATLISAFSSSLTELVVWRFITGLGLGSAMPLAVTLSNEFAPTRRRALLTSAMFTGFPLGAALGGFLSAWMIPHFGWRSVLVLGGVAPLVLVVLMLVLMPESVRYMVKRNMAPERIVAVLKKISSSVGHATQFILTETQHVAVSASGQEKQGIALILSRSYIVGSTMIWLTYGMGIVIFYALINWMPILLRDAGLNAQDAVLITSLFPLGGVGAIVFGLLMDRFNANRVIMLGFIATAFFIYMIGQVADHKMWLVLMVFIGGAIMNTSQSSLPALAANFYPTAGRATGVAWMMAIGRIGAVIAPFLVAELQRREFTFDQIFTVLAFPGLIAALALFIKNRAHPERK